MSEYKLWIMFLISVPSRLTYKTSSPIYSKSTLIAQLSLNSLYLEVVVFVPSGLVQLCHLQPSVTSFGKQWKCVILLWCCQTTFTDTWHAKTQDQDSDVCIHSTTPTTVSPPFSHPDSAKEGDGADCAAHSRPNVLVSSTAISSFS